MEVTWRPLDPTDHDALVALVERCAAIDGGALELSAERFLGESVTSIGAKDATGRLLAVGSVNVRGEFTDSSGMVDPTLRGNGLGRRLLEWATKQLAPGTKLRIRTEALSESAERLYARNGLACTFAEDVMRHDLGAAVPAVAYPDGVTVEAWSEDTSGQFFAAYQASFRDRPGFPDWTYEQWTGWMVDDDFRPDLSLFAALQGNPAAFITTTSDWIIQVGVDPAYRGRRLGAALVADVLARMRAEGGKTCMLDVNVNNPNAANLYHSLGFATIGRRATYEPHE
ncbi:GNAT family N-acetyltransferase [Tenggerimyces flavus]|uniref:GNAT family N-acetyltransferase n=1 Tax=Tenggerimyces flavus TaxID=1708749 RepID=A0ABV7Y954_9ACTN|nr:GNAT family N-acetyltransferase [Tenggerimyces flavus]MBM7785556.1 mycothiol synthase [Tenggerimyces flavus]